MNDMIDGAAQQFAACPIFCIHLCSMKGTALGGSRYLTALTKRSGSNALKGSQPTSRLAPELERAIFVYSGSLTKVFRHSGTKGWSASCNGQASGRDGA